MIEWGKLDKQLIHTAYHRFSRATKHTQNRIEQKTTILEEAFAIKDYLSGLYKSWWAEEYRRLKKDERILKGRQILENDYAQWPIVASYKTELQYLHDYWVASQWKPPSLCAVCSRSAHRLNIRIYDISNTPDMLDRMNMLRIQDPWAIQKCIVQQNSNEFVYGNFLDGIMLDKHRLSHLLTISTLFYCIQCGALF